MRCRYIDQEALSTATKQTAMEAFALHNSSSTLGMLYAIDFHTTRGFIYQHFLHQDSFPFCLSLTHSLSLSHFPPWYHSSQTPFIQLPPSLLSSPGIQQKKNPSLNKKLKILRCSARKTRYIKNIIQLTQRKNSRVRYIKKNRK